MCNIDRNHKTKYKSKQNRTEAEYERSQKVFVSYHVPCLKMLDILLKKSCYITSQFEEKNCFSTVNKYYNKNIDGKFPQNRFAKVI